MRRRLSQIEHIVEGNIVCVVRLDGWSPPSHRTSPSLRAVCLRSEREADPPLTTTHRMCDGISVFLIVRDPITVRDMIAGYRSAQTWKRLLAARLLNGALALMPSSRRKPENNEHALERIADRAYRASPRPLEIVEDGNGGGLPKSF